LKFDVAYGETKTPAVCGRHPLYERGQRINPLFVHKNLTHSKTVSERRNFIIYKFAAPKK
ncbi:MAG: hypothetical protein FWH10_01115, partial [Oscillospiraceae bacterium]|nr:hypothetical protein [Oscillospiraceae bacterium]